MSTKLKERHSHTKQGESITLISEAREERTYHLKCPSQETGEAPKCSKNYYTAITTDMPKNAHSTEFCKMRGRVSPSGTAKIELHVRNER